MRTSQDAMNVVGGATIERTTRINRPDDENGRCRVSRARAQPNHHKQLRMDPLHGQLGECVPIFGALQPAGY
jgi:hypothetical protein